MLKRMSPFDWLQIALGFIYYVRRIIMACSSLLACRQKKSHHGGTETRRKTGFDGWARRMGFRALHRLLESHPFRKNGGKDGALADIRN